LSMIKVEATLWSIAGARNLGSIMSRESFRFAKLCSIL
jgi:hypothetical protein